METAIIKNGKSEEIQVTWKASLFVNNLKENLGLKVIRKSIQKQTTISVSATDEGVDIKGYSHIQFTNACTPIIEYEAVL